MQDMVIVEMTPVKMSATRGLVVKVIGSKTLTEAPDKCITSYHI